MMIKKLFESYVSIDGSFSGGESVFSQAVTGAAVLCPGDALFCAACQGRRGFKSNERADSILSSDTLEL